MTWDQQRRRAAALDAVLGFAASYPDADLPFVEMPGLTALFGDRRGLLLALQQRWEQRLAARLAQRAQRTPALAPGAAGAPAAAAVRAWCECAAAEPELRRLLDRHLPELGDAAQERHEAALAT